MATKSVYLYGITMGHGNKEEEVAYCYARNAGIAVDSFKEIYKEKKYDFFLAKMFGEADMRIHPKPFEPMSREEVEYISRHGLAKADAYAQRKTPLPNGEFISADKAAQIFAEGEVV